MMMMAGIASRAPTIYATKNPVAANPIPQAVTPDKIASGILY
jgi:hypothetical protein